MENQDYAEVVGSSQAPYLNSLIADYGLATNYSDSGVHPSLPNYLYMVSGNTQYPGNVDVDPTSLKFPVDADNLGSQLTAAKIPWRSYQEDMSQPCLLTDVGNYAPRHDPFLYFKGIQQNASLCASTNVDLSAFDTDLASGKYRYLWVTPNLLDDGHDPADDPSTGLEQSDTWCAAFIPKILASKDFAEGAVLFITWDEAEGRNGDSPDKIPMIVVSKRIKHQGMTVSTALSHASYLATVEQMFGLKRLGDATNATTLQSFLQ